MSRISGKNGQKKAEAGGAVLFPGPEQWELWAGGAVQPDCVRRADQPRKLHPPLGCVMALPSRSFLSVPVWVPVVEDSPTREQTQIKLEMKGVLGANPDAAIWNFGVIRREALPAAGEGETLTRQLEAAAVLSSPFQEEWVVEEAQRYEPAGRMLPPPGSGSLGVLRRELGRWVADFYQDGKWLHTQPLLANQLNTAAAVELKTTLAQLEGEGVLPRVEWWVRQPGESLSEEFRRLLDADLKPEEHMVPRSPTETWNLPPPALTERRIERSRLAQRKKMIQGGLTAYLAVGFVVMSFLAWPLIRLKLGQVELRKISAEAGSIRDTAMLWREAAGWLDSRRNALELLWQVSRPLIETEPAKVDGVRLTFFDLNPKRLLLSGEGKDLEQVEKYLQWLKNEPALAGFVWKTPQPKLLPNGNAQFQAEGIPPGAVTEGEEGGENENANTP